MKRIKFVFGIIPLVLFLTNCSKSTNQEAESKSLESDSSAIELSNNSNKIKDSVETDNSIPEDVESDSLELTQLIRQVYTWRASNRLDDFPYKYDKSTPEIFIGIDWNLYDQNVAELIATEFFSKEFLTDHKSIALTLDSTIRKADVKWRNIYDGIPIWSTDADDWCGCQDYPDEYWKILTITNLERQGNLATFYWTWDSGPTDYPHNYRVTAKKTNNEWKINSLEGFKHYQSAEYYSNIMNGNSGG